VRDIGGRRLLVVAIAAVAAVVLPYVALGGAAYEPTPVRDPCEQQEWQDVDGLEETLEQMALTGFARAACELGVSREELVLALRSEAALDRFAAKHGLDRDEVDRAVRDGVSQAIDEAEEAGDLSGLLAPLVRRAVEELPPHLLLEAVQRVGSFVP
jgi:hypothetical protein